MTLKYSTIITKMDNKKVMILLDGKLSYSELHDLGYKNVEKLEHIHTKEGSTNLDAFHKYSNELIFSKFNSEVDGIPTTAYSVIDGTVLKSYAILKDGTHIKYDIDNVDWELDNYLNKAVW